MNRIKLLSLLERYKKEVSFGEYSHLKDMIGASVIADLTSNGEYYININNVYSITLLDLLNDAMLVSKNTEEYTIPSMNEIKYEKERLNLRSKYDNVSVAKAANTWTDLMVTSNIVSEGQTVNPEEIRLEDYIVDNDLRDTLPLQFNKSKGKGLARTNK